MAFIREAEAIPKDHSLCFPPVEYLIPRNTPPSPPYDFHYRFLDYFDRKPLASDPYGYSFSNSLSHHCSQSIEEIGVFSLPRLGVVKEKSFEELLMNQDPIFYHTQEVNEENFGENWGYHYQYHGDENFDPSSEEWMMNKDPLFSLPQEVEKENFEEIGWGYHDDHDQDHHYHYRDLADENVGPSPGMLMNKDLIFSHPHEVKEENFEEIGSGYHDDHDQDHHYHDLTDENIGPSPGMLMNKDLIFSHPHEVKEENFEEIGWGYHDDHDQDHHYRYDDHADENIGPSPGTLMNKDLIFSHPHEVKEENFEEIGWGYHDDHNHHLGEDGLGYEAVMASPSTSSVGSSSPQIMWNEDLDNNNSNIEEFSNNNDQEDHHQSRF